MKEFDCRFSFVFNFCPTSATEWIVGSGCKVCRQEYAKTTGNGMFTLCKRKKGGFIIIGLLMEKCQKLGLPEYPHLNVLKNSQLHLYAAFIIAFNKYLWSEKKHKAMLVLYGNLLTTVGAISGSWHQLLPRLFAAGGRCYVDR